MKYKVTPIITKISTHNYYHKEKRQEHINKIYSTINQSQHLKDNFKLRINNTIQKTNKNS